MNARVSRFQVRFEVDGEGRVTGELESINKAAKDSAATAKKAGDDWYEFGEKIGQGIRYAGVTAAAGIGLILKNSIDAEKELSQLDAVLQSTGLAASYSRDQMVALAEGIAQASTYSAGEIVKAETRLLSYSGIVGEVFPEALQIAIDQAARLGIGVEQSAETIGRALESPTKAAAALAQQGFGAAFTDSVRKSIQALEDAGDTAGAQRIVIDILKESYEGAALAARNTLGGAAEALINTLADLTTGSDGSLEGATAAVNDLIDTLNDPSVREGFATIVNGVASITAELVEGIAKLASWMAQVREINGLASGGLQPGDAQYENLNARLGQAATERRDLQGWTGYKSAGQEEFRQQQIAKLDQEIAALQREITSRIKGEQFAGVTSRVLTDADNKPAAAAKSNEGGNQRSKKLTDEDRAAKQLQAAHDRMVGSYQEQLALQGDLSEAAKVRYLTEEGALAGLEPSQKELLRNLAAEADERERLADVQEEGRQITEALRTPLEVLNAELQRHAELLDAGAITQETYNRAVADSQEAYKRSEDAAAGHFRSMEKIVEEFSAGTQDRIGYDLYDAFSGNADRIEDRWKQMLLQLAAELAASKIMEYFNNSGNQTSGTSTRGGFWANVATAIGSFFGGSRATGGMTPAGSLYEVGEGGQPELFEQNGRRFLIPGAGGNVVPAQYAAMGGGGGAGGTGMVNIEVVNNGEPVNAEATATTQPDGSQLIRMVLSSVADDVANGGRVGSAIKSRFAVQERI